MRVYDAKKMACISTIYAKQKLNCLLFDPQPPVRSAAEEAEEEDTLGVPLISFPLFLFGI